MQLDDTRIGRAALVAAVAGTALAPIAALSRFATEDGKADLESDIVRAWAEPAADKLSPLLDWGSADTVYLTYGKLWTPILLTVLLCAFAVRRRRVTTGAETWGWRLMLTGLVGMTIGVTGSYWTPLLDEFFVAALPFILIAMVGGIVLGIALVRRGFQPRSTAVLLIAWLPLFFVLSDLIARGAALLPALWACGCAGWSLASAPESQAARTAVPA
jgi:hypothetical protein